MQFKALASVLAGISWVCLSACAAQQSSTGHIRARSVPATVHGALEPWQVQASIERQMEALVMLANQQWPGAGNVQVSFIVTPDGLPQSVRLVRSDFDDPAFAQALTRVIERLSFPASKATTVVSAYPVYFR
jgi:outer membrane biosynthesis protein TonB